MFNDLLLLEILIFINLFFFINVINIITIWYLAGIYLISLGLFLLINDSDIFIGFLWVIDLGVGLIFFIFILHFSNFLYQKSFLNLSNKFFYFFIFLFLFFYFFFIFFKNSININFNLQNNWFFFINWYDYYEIFYNFTITDLNLIREMYFFNNSFEFFLINFMLFYGIFSSINLTFFIKRIFNFLTFSQLINFSFLFNLNSYLFIRNQNFIKQQNISTGIRVWLKKKKIKLMIFKKTWLNVSDGSNVKWVQTFHLYQGFFRKKTKIGFFIKSSARIVEPPKIEYKGFKIKYNKKGDICRGLIIRNKFFSKKKDGMVLYFKKNNLILLKKKYELKSKYLYGPVINILKRKKIINLYKIII